MNKLLIDKRMLIGGLIMIVIGITISWYLTESMPVGKADMTEDERLNLLLAERENSDYRLLSGILIGFGFLLILVSFGARRKRKGDAEKIEKKTTSVRSKFFDSIEKCITLFWPSFNFFHKLNKI